jgi:antagonist of KipI
MMDCQTIGGYPKLAAIIAEDQPRFAQMRPGSQVRFSAIDVETAHSRYRDYRLRLASPEAQTAAIARQSGWVVTSGW